MPKSETQTVNSSTPAPGVFQGVIKEVIERVLSKQPITRREFKKYVEDLLTQKLGDEVRVEYLFDGLPIWRETANIDLGDGAYLIVWNIKEDDVVEIINTGLDSSYFNIRIEGKLVEICKETCEYVMVNCELRKVEPEVSE
jgi:hypothetical protein